MGDDNKIDFVVTWVDGSDKTWIESKRKYAQYGDQSIDIRDNRYRDWGLMLYWFRAVENYAPWVRKVFFVTCGHLPEWLNLSCEKLVVVKHSDFMDESVLPTFNSDAIEVNLHKIKGLSEQFVYFNDDMIITSAVKPTDFFKNGMPVDIGVENVNPLVSDKQYYVVNSIMRNCTRIINDHFDKRTFIKGNFIKWYSPLLKKNVIRNILLSPWKQFCGFYTYHMPTPFLKETFVEIYDTERALMEQVSNSKFRSDKDVSQWLFQFWQYAKGKYVLPINLQRKVFEIGYSDLRDICNAIEKKKYKIVCINDVDDSEIDYISVREKLEKSFEKVLTVKSRFEI